MKTVPAIALGAVLGLAAGGAVGYFLTRKQLEAQYSLELDETVQEVKDYYNALFIARSEGYDTVAEAAEALVPETSAEKLVKSAKKQQAEIIEEMEYDKEEPKELTETAANIFEERDKRKPGQPYLIDLEEFMEEYTDEKGRVYDKMNLVWFEGDGVLSDESETMVDNADEIVGLDNMNRFGEGEDSMILHIRNEKAGTDYEVAKDERSFSHVVFGITEAELEDTPRKRAKKQLEE